MKRLFYLSVSLAIVLLLLARGIKPWKHQLTLAAICVLMFNIALYLSYLVKHKGRIDRN